MSEHELTCGLEIHQQLDTRKLFCDCRTVLVDEEGSNFMRRLRPTQSELGEIDRAALVQAEKKLRFRYQAPRGSSCLVDADEEPPHAANADALDIVLTFAAMLDARPVDEVHFMRKLVIDGSNTTGFQRTAMIATDGRLEVNGRSISVPTFCLEEDAARKVDTKAGEVTYRLDRLGIPLIEVATGPELHTPEEVKEAAQRLGSMMRATRKVKRGIGTIREDVNISIPGGARVEIKGVQELRMLPLYVEKEVERQRSLLRIRDILRERNVTKRKAEIRDISSLFASCPSKVIAGALKKGGKVLGSPLPGFAGVLRSQGRHAAPRRGDGPVRADQGRGGHISRGRAPGLRHRPELRGTRFREAFGLGPQDAFVLCADEPRRAEAALTAAVNRAYDALKRRAGGDPGPVARGCQRIFAPAAGRGANVPRDRRAADNHRLGAHGSGPLEPPGAH